MPVLNEVLNELHRGVGLEGGDHVASLGHHNGCKVFVVAIPATHLLGAIELVQVFVHLAWLQIEHFAIGEVNLLDPLKLRSNTVLHIVVSDVYEDPETA